VHTHHGVLVLLLDNYQAELIILRVVAVVVFMLALQLQAQAV
jgi:hypothetical protein